MGSHCVKLILSVKKQKDKRIGVSLCEIDTNCRRFQFRKCNQSDWPKYWHRPVFSLIFRGKGFVIGHMGWTIGHPYGLLDQPHTGMILLFTDVERLSFSSVWSLVAHGTHNKDCCIALNYFIESQSHSLYRLHFDLFLVCCSGLQAFWKM